MINWQSLIFNSFWLMGLALLLAAFSYHYWLAGQNSRQLRLQLSEPGFLKPAWLSLVFVGIGLAGSSQATWELVLWGAVTLLAFVFFIGLYR